MHFSVFILLYKEKTYYFLRKFEFYFLFIFIFWIIFAFFYFEI